MKGVGVGVGVGMMPTYSRSGGLRVGVGIIRIHLSTHAALPLAISSMFYFSVIT
jgi:hypothetical protein